MVIPNIIISMRTLFVCTGNTCRSPMAERLARLKHPGHKWESAGVIPVGPMHPMTLRVLSEYKADTQQFAGRDVTDLDLAAFDCIVLIGETARNLTPDPPPSVETHFWDVPDPYNAVGTSDEVVEVYRQCAVELMQRIENLLRQSR